MHVASGKQEDLRAGVRAWVQNAVAFLKEQTHTGRQPPQFQRVELSYAEPQKSMLDRDEIKIPDVHTFIKEHQKSLMLLEGFTTISSQLRANEHTSYHLWHLIGTEINSNAIRPDDLLHKFLAKMWWHSREFEFHDDVFDHIYASLMEFFKAPVIKCNCITPMPTLKVDEDLQFSTGVRIRALEENEFDRLFVTSEVFRRLFAVRFKGTRLFAIDCDTMTNKPLDQMKVSAEKSIQEHIWVDVASGRKMTNDVRSVLHIFKSGALKAEFMLVNVANGWGDLSTFSLEDVDQVSDPYEIQSGEVKAIRDLWEVYGKRSWAKHKFLQVAIDRLNYGSTRARPEDSIIDYVVSLEALLLHDLQTSDRGELRNRFALRGARLLASDVDERKRIFKDLKAIYDVRSAIVHGSSSLPLLRSTNTNPNVNEFARLVATYLRTFIKRFFEFTETGRSVLVDWDHVLLS